MNVENIKKDFPLLENRNITYLDSGATTQKPIQVINAIEEFYKKNNANPHRGAYTLSIEATEAYESTRQKIAKFINAKHPEEIIFSKNATESLNLIAYSYGMDNLKKDDEVVISIMEHHSNLVPWQKVTKATESKLNYMYINEEFELSNEEIETKITDRTKIVGIAHVSNVLGTINNVKKIIYASSSSVYGDNKYIPKIEYTVGNPLSPYALTKKVNELYASLFSSLYGLNIIGLRYFNVFGKRQDPNSEYSAVIPKFINSLLNGITPTINGDGSYSRDFTYVENVIEANLKACKNNTISGEVFNIGCGDTITLNELYYTLANILNFKLPPIYGPKRLGDIPHSNADITKAKKLLNYNPSYSFYDGIKLTLDWYKKTSKI